MKRVRFEDPEEFIADCGVVFERELTGWLEPEQPVELKDKILLAIDNDDVAAFTEYASTCSDIFNSDFYEDYSVLHAAVKKDALKIVDYILTSQITDVDISSLDYDSTTPLFWAIKEDYGAMVEMLLDFGASENVLNIYGDSAVFVAVYYSRVTILRFLVQRGCSCNHETDGCRQKLTSPTKANRLFRHRYEEFQYKQSPLEVALIHNSAESMRILIQGGANIQGDRFQSTLCIAIGHRGTGDAMQEIINLLTSRKNEENTKILVQMLKDSVRVQNVDVCGRLLKYVDGEDTLNYCMSTAVRSDNMPLIKLFIESNAQVTEDNIYSVACYFHINTLRYLLKHFVWTEGRKRSCIQYIMERGRYSRGISLADLYQERHRLWYMADHREDISYKHSQFLQILQLLLDHGAFADSFSVGKSESRCTALHDALDNGLVCPALFLLMAGADPTIPDKNGHTPFYTITHQLLQIDQMHIKKKENLWRLLHGLDLITLSYSKEATKISALLTRPDYGATLKKLPDHVVSLITRPQSQPLSLMNACRMQIVNRCSPNSHRKIHSLLLPTAIKKYLLFRDLDEMLLEMAGRKRKIDVNGAESTVPKSEDFSNLVDSSESDDDEDKDYVIAENITKKNKNTKNQKKLPIIQKPEPKIRKKLCLCTI